MMLTFVSRKGGSVSPPKYKSSNVGRVSVFCVTRRMMKGDTTTCPTGGVDKTSCREIYRYMGEQIKAVFHAVQAPDSGKVAYGAGDSLYRMKATPLQESVKWNN